jgi:serine phosphatase RsbU (regulator of sigma subunit)
MGEYASDLGLAYLYSMTVVDGKAKYVLDGAPQSEIDEGNFKYPMDEYADAGPLFFAAWEKWIPMVEEYTDSFGSFRSYFLPIVTKAGNKAMIGADMKIDDVKRKTRNIVFSQVSIAAIILAIGVAITFIFTKVVARRMIGMAHDCLPSMSVPQRCQVSMKRRYIIFSLLLFLIISSAGFVVFATLRPIAYENVKTDLMWATRVERQKLEAELSGQIALVQRMAGSLLIRRHLQDPSDHSLRTMAFEELSGYSKAFAPNDIFWISDRDKKYHYNDKYLYTLDPAENGSEWYGPALNMTNSFQLKVNFDIGLKKTMLWIDAPVFDNNHVPVGLVGIGVYLDNFVKGIYQNYQRNDELYFFNIDGEITGAHDISLIENRVGIADHLGNTGKEILTVTKQKSGIIGLHSFETKDKRSAIAIDSIPMMGWYVVLVHHYFIFGDFLPTGMTLLFIAVVAINFVCFVVHNLQSRNLLSRLIKANFKTKMLIPILTILFVSVLSISYFNYWLLYATIEKNANASLELFLDNILSQIKQLDTILDATKRTLNEKHIAIAKTIADMLDNAHAEMTTKELQRIAEPLDIIELSVANRNGILTNSSVPKYIGFDYKASETTNVYMKLTDGTLKELSEEPRRSSFKNDMGDINHYAGVVRKNGGFIQIGFHAGVIDLLQEEINIAKTIENTRILQNGFGLVFFDGRVTACPSGINERFLGLTPGMTEMSGANWYKTVSSGDGFAWVEINNKTYYAGFKSRNGYTIVGLIPKREFYSGRNQLLVKSLNILLFAIVVMSLVVYWLIGRLLQPVKYLVRGIEKIAEGDLDASIEGNYNDEFDKIKDAVNIMAADIKTYMESKLRAEHQAHQSDIEKARAEAATEAVMSSISYASKIQRNLLPPDASMEAAFSDYSVIWKPRDIVGGDIYWTKRFDTGTSLCVVDCTGHGTPGALLTMLVVSVLESIVWPSNSGDTAAILWQLDQMLAAALHAEVGEDGTQDITDIADGCDIAVLFIAKDGSVTLSSGHMDVFICDGREARRFRGQRIFVGEGRLKSKDDVETRTIPASPENKFYIASDGLYDQPGGRQGNTFGIKTFERILLDSHNEKQAVITRRIWEAFEEYRSAEPRVDDVELITFKP